jgi:hypothetical protein
MTEEKEFTKADVLALVANLNRTLFSRQMQGQTAYGGDRDYYTVLGYRADIDPEDYYLRYKRQDIAKRIVDLPAVDSFKKPPQISETTDNLTDTDFVNEFTALNKRLKFWSVLMRADKLTGLGEFGAILLGLKDGSKELSEPVNADNLKGQKSVLYMRPLSQRSVAIKDKDDDTQSRRFGLPTTYTITLDDETKEVHWSRVIHLAENKLDSEIVGVPRLEAVFNLLDDKMKAVGGPAEATWLNMRPGVAVSPQEDYQWDEAEWLQAVSNYLHDPARMLKAIGLDVEPIGTSEIVDPTSLHDVIIAGIAATIDMPQRKLMGSAGGQLSAASEDTKQWASTIVSRQENYVEPDIVRPIIDLFVSYGIFPPPIEGPGAYNVGTLQPDGSYAWPSIIELSETEKAAATRDQAAAARSLADPAGNLPLTRDEARQILRLPPEEPTPQDELEAETARAILANRKNGRVSDEALIAYAAAEALERAGELDE